MLLLKGLMTHCFLAVINLVPVGDIYIFGTEYSVESELPYFLEPRLKNVI